MASIETKLFDIRLKSPVILSSGPLSYGAEGLIRAFRAGAGAVVTKTIVREPSVNPIPHIAAAGRTVFNCEGNADIDARQWIEEEIPTALEAGVVVIASVGVYKEDVVELLSSVVKTGVSIIELTTYIEDQILPMVEEARKVTDLPILLKSRYYWKEQTYRDCFAAGANGVSAIDSVGPVLRIDIHTRKPLLGGEGGRGWMSGSSILPIALRVVADVRAMDNGVTIVGIGGVSSATDAVEMLMAGANAIGVCSLPMLRSVEVFGKLNHDLAKLMNDLGYGSVADISSVAQPNLLGKSTLTELTFDFDASLCNECLNCVTSCPYTARQLEEETMHVDESLCRNCGLCVMVCPTGALKADWLS